MNGQKPTATIATECAPVSPGLLQRHRYDVYHGDSIRRGYIDMRGEHREPTLQVDPSYDEPLEYQDPNGSHAGCLEHDIYYPVRKFRIGFHEEGNATVALWWWGWFNTPPIGPLPHPDF